MLFTFLTFVLTLICPPSLSSCLFNIMGVNLKPSWMKSSPLLSQVLPFVFLIEREIFYSQLYLRCVYYNYTILQLYEEIDVRESTFLILFFIKQLLEFGWCSMELRCCKKKISKKLKQKQTPSPLNLLFHG